MVIAMPSTHSPDPVMNSGGESSANEHDNDIKSGQSQCNPTTGAAVKDSRGKRKEKKSGLSLGSLKSPFKFLGKTYCRGCRKKCSGEVLRVNDVYFHNQCFRCKGCDTNLSQGGFFTKDKEYYCASCYQTNFGTKCNKCGQYVEGEVVTALGKTYHQNCFRCAGCQNPFPTGERVTFTGKSCLCQSCAAKDNPVSSTTTKNGTAKTSTSLDMIGNGNNVQGNDNANKTTKIGSAKATTSTSASAGKLTLDDGKCAGCNSELKDGQALMALDKHYHVWCFKCKACDALLHGEYMGKDGQPYCEKDYQSLFGVKCTYCYRFISGKVLQAGDNNHFHPTCARCTKCGEPFGDGEEMFLQGAAIWHPRCGPSPDESGIVVNGGGYESSIGGASPYPTRGGAAYHHSEMDGASTASELPPNHQAMHTSYGPYSSRASSPGASLRPYRGGGDPMHWRSTSHMAGGGGNYFMPSLYSSSSTYSLRRPIEAGDKSGSSSHLPHFHLPASRRASSSAGDRAGIPPPNARNSRPGTAMSEIPPGGGFRPVSAPPKPGYTHASVKASTLPVGVGLNSGSPAVLVGARTNGTSNNHYDAMSQASGKTDFSSDYMRASNTYTHGFRAGGLRAPTPLSPGTVMTEHKIYPLHLLFTTNYKLPPDIDRCNMEKHVSDADFEMVFNMSRDDFYAMPLWRRNDYKRRVRMF